MRGSAFALVLLSVACTEVVSVLTPPPDAEQPDAGAGANGGKGGAGGSAGSGGSDSVPDAGNGGAPSAGSGGEPGRAPVEGVTVDAGDAHACATRHGALYCWGSGSRGKLGIGDTADHHRPARVGNGSEWIGATSGSQHSCAVTATGEVFCFGANDVGQLGIPGMPESTTPVEVSLPGRASAVITEANTTCALLVDGRLFCWGENTEGQIGLSDGFPGENHFEPIEVGSLGTSGSGLYRAVDVGHGHVCGIRDSGALECWGRNTAEQLGLGPDAFDQIREPTRVGDSTDWRAVQAGQDSSCAIDVAGALYCWGTNTFANLGTGDRETYDVPTAVSPEIAFSEVSIDTFHSCAVDVGGALYCWGRGNEGQLANGEWVDREVPTAVPGETWRSVAVGRFYTCAVRADGAVFCSGSNDSGQLGQGDTERRSALSLVAFE
jgi:hypothetical protein